MFTRHDLTTMFSVQEIKILISYLQLVANFGNEVALDYCINVPPRGRISESRLDCCILLDAHESHESYQY